jgi:hypothetical protein
MQSRVREKSTYTNILGGSKKREELPNANSKNK